MIVSEFKAWFKGFSEHMSPKVPPTAKEWDRIRTEIECLTVLAPQGATLGWQQLTGGLAQNGQANAQNNYPPNIKASS